MLRRVPLRLGACCWLAGLAALGVIHPVKIGSEPGDLDPELRL
jgi:hypothetical protein